MILGEAGLVWGPGVWTPPSALDRLLASSAGFLAAPFFLVRTRFSTRPGFPSRWTALQKKTGYFAWADRETELLRDRESPYKGHVSRVPIAVRIRDQGGASDLFSFSLEGGFK